MDPYGDLVRQLMMTAMAGQVSADGYEFPEPQAEPSPRVQYDYPFEGPVTTDGRMALPNPVSVPSGLRAKRHDAYFVE